VAGAYGDGPWNDAPPGPGPGSGPGDGPGGGGAGAGGSAGATRHSSGGIRSAPRLAPGLATGDALFDLDEDPPRHRPHPEVDRSDYDPDDFGDAVQIGRE